MASLAARQRRIERDRQIAQAIADLAAEQQAAREQIKEQANRLGELAETKPKANPDDPHPNADAQRAAAEALQQAQQTFAEAQRATGEGAAEVSGQTEVANEPIRKGLESASQLQASNQPPESDMPAGGEAANASRRW